MSSLHVIACVLFLSSLSLSQVGFKKSAYDTTNFNGSVAVGDFNGDGYPDIAALDGPHGYLTIDRNNGDGNFTRTTQYSISTLENSGWVQTADFDGDGKLDLVFWVAFSPQMELWHGNGDGSFTFWKDVPNLVGPPLTVRLADVNKDGAVDLLARVVRPLHPARAQAERIDLVVPGADVDEVPDDERRGLGDAHVGPPELLAGARVERDHEAALGLAVVARARQLVHHRLDDDVALDRRARGDAALEVRRVRDLGLLLA